MVDVYEPCSFRSIDSADVNFAHTTGVAIFRDACKPGASMALPALLDNLDYAALAVCGD